MTDQAHSSPRIRFAEFEIDRQACALLRHGRRVPLQIQPFRVLETLVDNAGEVVTRATLCSRIWPGKVYIDTDRGLNNAVNRLRQALGDSGDAPVFIETLPRIGYRFVHPVEPSPVAPPAPAEAEPRPRSAWRTRLAMLAVLAVVTVTVAILLARWPGSTETAETRTTSAGQRSEVAEAQDAYLRGVKLLEQRNKESAGLAIRHLQRATELDPNFAEAFAVLASAYATAGSPTYSRYLSAEEAGKPALAAAERALQLDPDLGKAHVALARVLNAFQPASKPTDLAIEQSYRRGLELDPTDSDAHLQFGNFLAKRGRHDEALAQFRAAQALNPLSPSISSRLGQELMSAGQTAEGLELLRRTVELDPFQFNARVRLGWGYLATGNLDAAEQEFVVAGRISPDSSAVRSSLAYIAARKGDPGPARELLDALLTSAQATEDPFAVATVYVGLRDREKSLEWLGRTVQQTRILQGRPPWGLHTSMYDWLRDDPRFQRLLQEVHSAAIGGSTAQATR
jgi:DNA-binding winged helix-turn-helix (wHTH) protein/Tfp pilus assembly protein PilF